ncbi:hypothetical protein D1872_344090 [compost metagenome]
MTLLEITHEISQSTTALIRNSIIDRRSKSPYAAMTLEADEACLLGFLCKQLL